MRDSKWSFVFFKFGIGLIIGVVFCISFVLIRFNFGIITWQDGFFLTAFFLFIVGLCSFVNNEGFFDMISYGFSTIPYMFHIQQHRKYEDLLSYKDAKNIKRSDNKLGPLGYIFSAIFFLIIALILYMIIKLN